MTVILGAPLGYRCSGRGSPCRRPRRGRGVMALAVAIAAGMLAGVLSIVAIEQEAYKPGLRLGAWCSWECALRGVGHRRLRRRALAAHRFERDRLRCASGGARRLRGHALRPRFTTGASFYDRGGAPMVDVQSLRMKDGTILMKAFAVAVDAVDGLYASPEEVWKVLTMVPFDLD